MRRGGRFAARAPGSGRSAPTFQPHARLSLPQSSSRRNAPRGGTAAAGRLAGEGVLNARASPHPTHRPARKRFSEGNRIRLSKNSGELERAAALSNFQSCPAACTVGTGRFLCRKIPFSREKSVFLQFLRPEIFLISAKTGRGGRKAENPWGFQVSPLAKLPTAQIADLRRGTWPGSLLPCPPACQNFFDKQKEPSHFGAVPFGYAITARSSCRCGQTRTQPPARGIRREPARA